MVEDRAKSIERNILETPKASFRHLVKLWLYVVKNSKSITFLYLFLYIILSFMRPVAAFLWRMYVDELSTHLKGASIFLLIVMLLSYFFINVTTDILYRYIDGRDDIEQLNLVQVNRFQERMMSNIFKKLSKIHYDYWEIPQINDIISRNIQFLNDAWGGLSKTVMLQSYAIIAKFISVLSIGISLYIFNPWLCLSILVLPLPIFFTIFIYEKLRFKFLKDNSQLQRKALYYQNLLINEGPMEIKTMGLHDYFYKKWKNEIDLYRENEKKLYRTGLFLGIVNNLISNIVNVGTSIVVILLMLFGKISVGTLSAALSLISTLITDTSVLITSFSQFVSKKNEACTFLQMMDLPNCKENTAEYNTINQIKFDNVSYRYPMTEKMVLQNINITINKGERIALVGLNGAGKTTFVSILNGLLQPSLGKILINGEIVDKIRGDNFFSALSNVTQNPAHYTSFTVGDNVCFGDIKRKRNDNEIHDSLVFANLNMKIKDAMLGRDVNGIELSGGEWQKLAISRAHYRNRDFIVLDEPTSNLDPIAEEEIFQKYLDLSNQRTVIFVTHRISLAALAERIIVFDNGKIIGDATHGELMNNNRQYATMYNEQSKWYNR